jgi:hypothetical protein
MRFFIAMRGKNATVRCGRRYLLLFADVAVAPGRIHHAATRRRGPHP